MNEGTRKEQTNREKKTLLNAAQLVDEGKIDIPDYGTVYPPRIFVKLPEGVIPDQPEQVYHLSVMRWEDGDTHEARFSICIGKDRNGNPRLHVRAQKTLDSDRAELDRVVDLSGKFLDYK